MNVGIGEEVLVEDDEVEVLASRGPDLTSEGAGLGLHTDLRPEGW